MRDGVRILNVARGGLIDDAALKDALDSGKVARRRARRVPVASRSPTTRCSGYPNVVVTPHLGASTAEATDRAGYQSAEQVVAALTGGVVSTAVNIPAIGAEDMEVLGPFLPLATQLGRLAMALAEGSSVERIEAAFLGRIADFDTRLLDARGDRAARCRAAPRSRSTSSTRPTHGPAARASSSRRRRVSEAAGLQRADPRHRRRRRRARRGRRHRHRPEPACPHLVEVQGRRLTIELEPLRDRVPLRGPAGHDRPRRHDLRRARHQHLLGRRRPHARRAHDGDASSALAAMVVTTDAPCPTRSSRRSSPRRGSSTAGRSIWAERLLGAVPGYQRPLTQIG